MEDNQYPFSEPEEEKALPSLPQPGLARYERQMPIRQTSFYLCGDILAAQYYTDLFYALRCASDTDLVYLHLNTPGGDLDSGLQIINNMRASAARVVTVLESRAYSMGALIFLSGDELIVHDHCQLMFHTYSGSFSGRGNEQQAQVEALSAWFEKVMSRISRPFLSSAEVNRVLGGSDLWMDSDEIARRLGRMRRSQAREPHNRQTP